MTVKQIVTREEIGDVVQSLPSLTGIYYIFITERLNKGIKGFAPEKSQNLQGNNQMILLTLLLPKGLITPRLSDSAHRTC